ncbi:carbohydrate ABC transporter permease (plasmid) [Coraliomargarita sp. W4R53]
MTSSLTTVPTDAGFESATATQVITTRNSGNKRKRRAPAPRSRRRPNIIGAVLASIWLIIVALPIYYIVITSLRPQEGFFSANQFIPPTEPTLEQYSLVLQSDFVLYFFNSIVVTASSVIITVFVCLMAAYAMVRSRGRFLRSTFSLFLLGLAIPLQATIIPLFFMMVNSGLYDTLTALVLTSIGFAIPMTVLILVNFLRDIPNELFESMKLDGATNWRMLFSLVIPLTKPAIVTVGLYNALHVWNAFLFPLILTQSPENRVLPLSLWSFQGEFTTNVPGILAAVVLSTLPLFVLYLFGRRQLIAGLTAGFGK